MKRKRSKSRLSSPEYEIMTVLRLHGFKAKLFNPPDENPTNVIIEDKPDPQKPDKRKTEKS
jgi:hypothetical protein